MPMPPAKKRWMKKEGLFPRVKKRRRRKYPSKNDMMKGVYMFIIYFF